MRLNRHRLARLEALICQRELAASADVAGRYGTDPAIRAAIDAINVLADARTDHPPAGWHPGKLFDALFHELGCEPNDQDYLDAWRITAASATVEAAPHMRVLDDAIGKVLNR